MLKKSVKVTDSDQKWPFWWVSGPNPTSRTSYGSDFVLSVCNTCAGLYKVLWVTSRYDITPKMLKKSVKVTDSDQKCHFGGSSGPNSTSRTSYGVRLGSECLQHLCGSVKSALRSH